jgi:hypothetical protein
MQDDRDAARAFLSELPTPYPVVANRHQVITF